MGRGPMRVEDKEQDSRTDGNKGKEIFKGGGLKGPLPEKGKEEISDAFIRDLR